MSDPELKVFVLDNGQRAKVPADKVDKWMRRMDARGIGFTSEGAPTRDAAPPQPAPAPMPEAPSAAEPEEQAPPSTGDQPWYEVLGRGARDTASMGFADEAGGLGALLAGDDVERTAGPGIDAPIDERATAYTAERDAQRAADAQALREHPTLYRTGEAVGLAGTAAAPFAKLGKAAPAVLGAVNAAGSSERETPMGVASDAATGAVFGHFGGKALGAIAERVAPAAGRALGRMSSAARVMANKRYLRAAGAGKGSLDRMGDAGVERYAEGGRRLGIGGGFLPKTTERFGDDAQRVANEAYAQRLALQQVLEEKGGATVDPDKLARSIQELKSAHAPGGPTGQPLRDEIDVMAEKMRGMRDPAIKTPVDVDAYEPVSTLRTNIDPPSPLTPSAVKRIRAGEMDPELAARFQGGKAPTPIAIDVEQATAPTTLEIPRGIPFSRANKERGDLGKLLVPGSARAAVEPKVYGKLNEAMKDAANEVEPGVGDRWGQAGEDEHVGLLLNEFARGRENSEAANRILSLSDQGLGTAAGFAAGDPLTGVATAYANKAARLREHSIAERVLRAKSAAQGGVSRAMLDPRMRAAAAPAGARAGAPLAQRMPMFGAPAPAMADDGHDSLAEFAQKSPQDRAGSARGTMVPDAAMQLLQSQPDALGKWAPELLKARQQGEGQFSAAITRLQDDPEFARTVLPRLQAMTAAPR